MNSVFRAGEKKNRGIRREKRKSEWCTACTCFLRSSRWQLRKREEERLYRVISPREDARSPESRSTFPLRNAPSFFETITTIIYLIDVNVDLTWNTGDI